MLKKFSEWINDYGDEQDDSWEWRRRKELEKRKESKREIT